MVVAGEIIVQHWMFRHLSVLLNSLLLELNIMVAKLDKEIDEKKSNTPLGTVVPDVRRGISFTASGA